MIDDLDYDCDGNQLKNVTDKTNHPAGFNDGNKHQQANLNDFEYDDYGNLTRNRDKKISNIVYNHLHLPVEITFDGGQKIEYLYTASGIKLEKTAIDDNNSATITEYMDGFQYKNDVLQFFPHAEGYVQATQSSTIGNTQLSFHYVYNYTDHLGNIRLKYTIHPQTGEIRILEENHYYPYGLTHKGYSEKHSTFAEGPGGGITLIPVSPNVNDPYKYKFGGKEYQEEFDVNVYDFGARNYDPSLGRWMNVDPLAEQMRRHSPYNYAFNNPVFFIDPDGMAPLAGMQTGAVESYGGSHGYHVATMDENREIIDYVTVNNKQGVDIHADGTLEKNNLQTRGDVFNSQLDAAFGDNVDKAAPATKETVNTITQDVPILKSEYNKDVNINISPTEFATSKEFFGASAITYSDNGELTGNPAITLFQSAFVSYRILGRILFHEFVHVRDFKTGQIYNDFIRLCGKDITSSQARKGALYLSEIRAYNEGYNITGQSYTSGYYEAKSFLENLKISF